MFLEENKKLKALISVYIKGVQLTQIFSGPHNYKTHVKTRYHKAYNVLISLLYYIYCLSDLNRST